MEIVLIAALSPTGVIGRGGRLPWQHPADLRFFRRSTWGHPVIMGRATYAALPRRPLPHRPTIVLSRQAALALPAGAVHCRSLAEALRWCAQAGHQRVFVAGGAQVYAAALPFATAMLLTWVPDRAAGDAHFPAFDPADWTLVGTRTEQGLTFAAYRRALPARDPHAPLHAGEDRAMFARLELAPPDPILGLTAAFKEDPNPAKINLGVGVYQDAQGQTPIFAAVKTAEARVLAAQRSKSYLPIEGSPEYAAAVQELVLGADHEAVANRRAVTVQACGGTGALRVAGDFIHQHFPAATVWLSEPTWANHPMIFRAAGVPVRTYPYFDAQAGDLAFAPMLAAVEQIPAGDVLLLHGCCHNPTGVDPTTEQWEILGEAIRARGILPLVDFAYQGLGDGLRADARGLQALCAPGAELLIASSFSKNFGLYNERVGALTLVAADPQAAARALSQLRVVVRTNFSNPPAHGAAIVVEVLRDPALRAAWEAEVDGMRARIASMRHLFVQTLQAAGVARDFSFIARQRGMFSFSGLAPEHVQRLRQEHSIYLVGSGRMNVAGMTPANMERLCRAIAAVLS